MPVQSSTDYLATHLPGFEGQVFDMEVTNITSRVAEGGDIPFGRAVVMGTGDNQAKLPTATGQTFLGFTTYTSAWAENASSEHLYAQYREMNILDDGLIYLYTEQSVVPGNSVYFRHTAGASPLNIIGRVRKDADGGNADLIQGAQFRSTTSAGGIAVVKLRSPGTGVLLAPDSSEIITAAGAGVVSIDTGITYIDSTLGAQALTLADGTTGQRKIIKMTVDGGDCVITPAHLLEGTTITLRKAGDSVELLFDGTNWMAISEPTATVLAASIETITAAGAVSVETLISLIDSTVGAIALTLADGIAGQRKIIKMQVDGGDATLTPANFFDGTTITFDDVNDSIEMFFDGTNWNSIGTATATIA